MNTARNVSLALMLLCCVAHLFASNAKWEALGTAVLSDNKEAWQPDLGNGYYKNPIINADYSDPDVCVGPSGTDYYLTASSFNCIPGLPILHSTDLVNWEIVAYALQEQVPTDTYDKPQHGKGVWAPSIRYHDGEFRIYWGDPDYGVYVVRAKEITGPWSKPHLVFAAKGVIDPTPLWDDDGRCYLVSAYAGSRARLNSVLAVRELNAEGTEAIGRPVIVFDGGQENHTSEGPKFYKRDGYYWIFCPAGGVAMGWQLAMRSRSPYGPYEAKKVLWQGNSDVNGPHQGAWIHTAAGEDWFIHFQDKGCYGRVLHLQPVDWSSGWPIMGDNGVPVSRCKKPKTTVDSKVINPQTSDEFNEPRLGLQWSWHANYKETFGQPTPYGFFRLYTVCNEEVGLPHPSLWNAPSLLLQKTPADSFTATTKVVLSAKEDGQQGGLVMMGRDYSAIVVRRVGDAFQLLRLTCIGADGNGQPTEQLIAKLEPTMRDSIRYSPAIHEQIYLRLKVETGGRTMFYYSADGKRYREAGPAFQMKEGKWIGAKFGYLCQQPTATANRGCLDIDWMRVTE